MNVKYSLPRLKNDGLILICFKWVENMLLYRIRHKITTTDNNLTNTLHRKRRYPHAMHSYNLKINGMLSLPFLSVISPIYKSTTVQMLKTLPIYNRIMRFQNLNSFNIKALTYIMVIVYHYYIVMYDVHHDFQHSLFPYQSCCSLN